MPKAKQHEHHVYTDWKRIDGVLYVRCFRCGHLRQCVAKEPYMMVIARSSGDKQRAPVGHPGALGQLSVMMANASMTVLCCLGQPDLAPQWQNHTSFQP